MALARGILAWLPLQRLLDLYWPGPGFQSIVALRASAVNQLSRSELEYWLALPRLQKFRPDLRYVAICTYQGELTKMGDFFLPYFYLCRRAVFLGDANAAEYFVAARGVDFIASNTQEMFESNNPAIWATLLGEGLVTPRDPYAFTWTEGLRSYFQRQLQQVREPDEDEYILAGTMGLLTLWSGTPNHMQVQAYLQRLVRETPDGLLRDFGQVPANYPGLPLLLVQADAINSILSPSPKDRAYLQLALENVQPNVLRLLLPRLGPVAVSPVQINEYVTKEVVRRAEVILGFLPKWPQLENYREQLLLITGRQARHPELWPNLLVSLAHPQLAGLWHLDPEGEPYSVLYQPELWLVALSEEGLRNDAFASCLYARGLFLSLLQRVNGNFAQTGRSDPFDVPSPEARFPDTHRMTRANFRLLLEYGIPLPSLRSIYFPRIEDAEAARQLYPPGPELEAKALEAEEREQRWLEIREELLQ